MAERPWCEVPFEIRECRLEFIREPGLVQHKATAHFDDGIDVLDHYRAFLHTRHACRACPELLLCNEIVKKLVAEKTVAFVLVERISAFQCFRLFHRTGTEIHKDLPRTQELACGMCRAGVTAPAAFGAGVPVQQLLPGKVIDIGCTEFRRCLIGKMYRRKCTARTEVRKIHVGD